MPLYKYRLYTYENKYCITIRVDNFQQQRIEVGVFLFVKRVQEVKLMSTAEEVRFFRPSRIKGSSEEEKQLE